MVDFYTKAGHLFAIVYGNIPYHLKINYINKFKTFVDSNGGPESFKTIEDAFEKFKQTERNSRGH